MIGFDLFLFTTAICPEVHAKVGAPLLVTCDYSAARNVDPTIRQKLHESSIDIRKSVIELNGQRQPSVGICILNVDCQCV